MKVWPAAGERGFSLPLLYSTLLRPHQEPFIQLWGSQYMENMDLLEPKEGNENDQKAETSPE